MTPRRLPPARSPFSPRTPPLHAAACRPCGGSASGPRRGLLEALEAFPRPPRRLSGAGRPGHPPAGLLPPGAPNLRPLEAPVLLTARLGLAGLVAALALPVLTAAEQVSLGAAASAPLSALARAASRWARWTLAPLRSGGPRGALGWAPRRCRSASPRSLLLVPAVLSDSPRARPRARAGNEALGPLRLAPRVRAPALVRRPPPRLPRPSRPCGATSSSRRPARPRRRRARRRAHRGARVGRRHRLGRRASRSLRAARSPATCSSSAARSRRRRAARCRSRAASRRRARSCASISRDAPRALGGARAPAPSVLARASACIALVGVARRGARAALLLRVAASRARRCPPRTDWSGSLLAGALGVLTLFLAAGAALSLLPSRSRDSDRARFGGGRRRREGLRHGARSFCCSARSS